MLYMELYVYDYLKKRAQTEEKQRGKIELWGESKERDFYVCELRSSANRKLFCGSLQYLGDFGKVTDTKAGRKELIYFRHGEMRKQEMLIYIAKETKAIESFLIDQKEREDVEKRLKNRPMPKSITAAEEKRSRDKTVGRSGWLSAEIVICCFLIVLAANMIDSLCSYENMMNILEVVELLMK